ncbi:hypothetical protein PENANT_c001G09113 [Penicillium antarcticum]|uniref:Uncharacterized protein n=1 Tax=Penicillium antarcticum TaxID=416450 RepID=A0A1V6QNB5_9EURO|nr:hypothetical protein PENANT_c001G09113 [Penicillium antarcticum]
MSSHALDRDSNNDPTDEPTEPEPIDPHPYGEQIQIFINPHGDRLTAEEEIFIHFVRPLAYRLILESVFTYTQEMQQILPGFVCICFENGMLSHEHPAVLSTIPQMAALFSQIQEISEIAAQTERMIHSDTECNILSLCTDLYDSMSAVQFELLLIAEKLED